MVEPVAETELGFLETVRGNQMKPTSRHWILLSSVLGTLVAAIVGFYMSESGFASGSVEIAGVHFLDEAPTTNLQVESSIPSSATLSDVVSTYDIDLPSWLPNGFDVENDAEVSIDVIAGDTVITIGWHQVNLSGPQIGVVPGATMTVIIAPYEGDYLVGVGGVSTTTINSIPVARVNGAWREDSSIWDSGGNADSLMWSHEGDRYTLSGNSFDHLVDVAATMEHFGG